MKTLYAISVAFAFITLVSCSHDPKYPAPVPANNNTVPPDDTSNKPIIKDAIDSLAGVYIGYVNWKTYYEGDLTLDSTYSDTITIIKSDIYSFMVTGAIYSDTVRLWHEPDNQYLSNRGYIALFTYPSKDSIYVITGHSGHANSMEITFRGKK